MADYSELLKMVDEVISESNADKQKDKIQILRSAIKTNEENVTAMEGSVEKLEKENADLARLNNKLYLQIPSKREEKEKEKEKLEDEEEHLSYEDLFKEEE